MYLNLKDLKINLDIEVPDKPTVYAMSDDTYRNYIKEQIYFKDSSGGICEAITGRPIATTREQLDILIEELTKRRHVMASKNE